MTTHSSSPTTDAAAPKTAILIGNSDGIGRKVTELLLTQGYQVTGLSRSSLDISHTHYRHLVQDVTSENYKLTLHEVISSLPRLDLCIYFAGIGDFINFDDLAFETKVFQVNAMGAVVATEVAITKMLKHGSGHFIGLSSIMDVTTSPQAPSYCASKAAVSKYWESLGLSLKGKNIHVSNVRFGFVDTKMAKGSSKPFIITADDAAEFILDVIAKPRIRATKPLLVSYLAWLLSLPTRLKLLFS